MGPPDRHFTSFLSMWLPRLVSPAVTFGLAISFSRPTTKMADSEPKVMSDIEALMSLADNELSLAKRAEAIPGHGLSEAHWKSELVRERIRRENVQADLRRERETMRPSSIKRKRQ